MSNAELRGLTVAGMLARGLNLPALAVGPVECPAETNCALCGVPIEQGYRVSDIVSEATAEFLDCFRGGIDGWVSEEVARCFKNADPRRGNPCSRSLLIFEDGTAYMPLISHESAVEQGRPCWSELIRSVWPGRGAERCLVILTTDTKKRLWIRARVGQLGHRTPVLYYDSETAGNEVLLVSWPGVIACLDAVELAYNLGFPKSAIRQSLYQAGRICQELGLPTVRRNECKLETWRGKAEFTIATLVAQRKQKQGGESEQLNFSVA